MADVRPRIVQCRIVNCQPFSSKCSDLTYHIIPKNAEKRRLWIKTIGKKNLRNPQSSRLLICSLHFEKTDFVNVKYGQEKDRRHLVASAVPSKFPWSENWADNFTEHPEAAPGPEDTMDSNNETAQVAKLKIYRCQMCTFVSNNKNDYQNHLKNHSTVCHICQFKTAGVKRLVRHIEKNHKTEIRFRCSACNFGSDKCSLAESHIKSRMRSDPQHRRAKVVTLRKSRKRKIVTENDPKPKKKKGKKVPEELEAKAQLDEPDKEPRNEENDTVEMEDVVDQEADGGVENGTEAEEDFAQGDGDNSDGKTIYVCKICLYWSTNQLGADIHAKKHLNSPLHCSVCFACFQKHAGAATHMTRTKTPIHTDGRIIFLTGLCRTDLIAKTEVHEPRDAGIGYFTPEEPIIKDLFPDRDEFFKAMLENSSHPVSKRRKALMLTRRKRKRGAVASKSNRASVGDATTSYRKVYACPHCDYWSSVCDLFLRHLEVHGIYKKRHRCSACDAVFSWFSKANLHVTEAAKSSGDHETAQVITTDEGSASYVVKLPSLLMAGRKQGFLKDIRTSAVGCNSDVEDARSMTSAAPELEQESEPIDEPATSSNPPAESTAPAPNDTATWVNDADGLLSISPVPNEQDDMLKLDCVFPMTAGFRSDVSLESLSSQGCQRTLEELEGDESRLRSELVKKSNSMVRNNVSLKDLLKTLTQSRKTLADLETKYNGNRDRLTRALADQREMESLVKNTQDRLADLQKDFDFLSSSTLQSELNVRSKQVELIKLQISKAPAEECDVLSSEIADLETKLLESKSGMEAVKVQMRDIEERMRKVQADLTVFDVNQGSFISEMQQTEQRIRDLKDIIKDSDSNVEIVLSKRIDLMKSLLEIKYSLEIIRINKILSRPDYTKLLMSEMEGVSHRGTQTDPQNPTTDAATSTATIDETTTPESEDRMESAAPAMEGIESQSEEEAAAEQLTNGDIAEEFRCTAVIVNDMEVSMEVELVAETHPEEADFQPSAAAEIQPPEYGDEEDLVVEAVMETLESSPARMQTSSHSASTEMKSTSASEGTHSPVVNEAAKNVQPSEEPNSAIQYNRSGDSAASPSSSGHPGPNSATKGNPPVIVAPINPRRLATDDRNKVVATNKSVPELIPVPEFSKTTSVQEKVKVTSEGTRTEIRQELGIPKASVPKEIVIRMAPLEDMDCLRSDDELVEFNPPGVTSKSSPEISVLKAESTSSSSFLKRAVERSTDSDDPEDVVFLSSISASLNRRKEAQLPLRHNYPVSSTTSVYRLDSVVKPSTTGLLSGVALQSISPSSTGPTSQAGTLLPAATVGLIRAKGKYYPSSVISLAGPSAAPLSSQLTSSHGSVVESGLTQSSPSSSEASAPQSFVVESVLTQTVSVSRGQALLQSNGNWGTLTSLSRPGLIIPVRAAPFPQESGPRMLRCHPPQTVIPRSNISLLKPEFNSEDLPRSSAAYMRLSPTVSKPLPTLTVAPFAKDVPRPRPLRIIDSIGPPPAMSQGPLFRHPISNSINGFVNSRYREPNQPGPIRFGPIRPPLNRNMRPF